MDGNEKLPKKGEVLTIEAHGRRFTVKKNSSGRDWHLFEGKGGRTRFGNAREIREDIRFIRENGCLPPSKAHLWA